MFLVGLGFRLAPPSASVGELDKREGSSQPSFLPDSFYNPCKFPIQHRIAIFFVISIIQFFPLRCLNFFFIDTTNPQPGGCNDKHLPAVPSDAHLPILSFVMGYDVDKLMQGLWADPIRTVAHMLEWDPNMFRIC